MTTPIPLLPILNFPGGDPEAFLAERLHRKESDTAAARQAAETIVDDVRRHGDEALLRYTARFDRAALTPETLRVSDAEIRTAYAATPPAFVETLRRAVQRIRAFHEKQYRAGWLDTFGPGEMMGQMVRPIDSVGVYVPGGTAALASSMLMLAVPATVAGVRRIAAVTPPSPDGTVNAGVLVAAAECGVTEIYKAGGAQAVAALAFGTASVRRVDKIVGPGNIYVVMAKRAVFGYVGIDSLPGPSEIVVVADGSAQARHVAADMLSQAEHDALAAGVLITDSPALAEAVRAELAIQAEALPRRETVAASLAHNGMIIVAPDLFEAVRLSDTLAPEHLALAVRDPLALLSRVQNAGAVFLGHAACEPLGDYMAGPSHVLPTQTTARFFSPVSVDDFLKKTSVLFFDRPAMERLADDVIAFAEAEGLDAHANAVRVRREG